jgi:hypothetical protein
MATFIRTRPKQPLDDGRIDNYDVHGVDVGRSELIGEGDSIALGLLPIGWKILQRM